jgi:hypothetical protein
MTDDKENPIDMSCLKIQLNNINKKLEKYRAKTSKYEKLYSKTKLKIDEKCIVHQWGDEWQGWHETGYTCKICGKKSFTKF